MAIQVASRLLTRSEVATQLGVSCRTLDRLVRDGALPVVYLARRPRFLTEDVAAFVRSRRQLIAPQLTMKTPSSKDERETTTRLWRAMMLAPRIDIWEALLRGETVPVAKLDPEWVARFQRKSS